MVYIDTSGSFMGVSVVLGKKLDLFPDACSKVPDHS